MKGTKGMIQEIMDTDNVVHYDPTQPFDLAKSMGELLAAQDKMPPRKSMTQVMQEFLDAHFETEEEKMQALKYYMDNIVPAICKAGGLI